MIEFWIRNVINLFVKLFSVFYFSKGLRKKQDCFALKVLTLALFVVFVLGQRCVLDRGTLGEAIFRNILLYGVTAFVVLSHYEGERPYLAFLSGVVFFLWGGWLKVFTPFVFYALHLPTFGYGVSELFPTIPVTLAENAARVISIVLLKKYVFEVSSEQSIGSLEAFLALLPALIDHTTILILYNMMIVSPVLQSPEIIFCVTLLILMLVFGMPCMLAATEQLFRLKRNRLEMARMESQMVQQIRNFEHKQELDAQLRSMQHDFFKHLSVIERMAQEDKPAVSEYVDDLLREAKNVKLTCQTGNAVTDALITQKAEICTEKKIRFECMADLKEAGFIRYADMVSLFANTLDNAIEANEKVDDGQRFITLSAGKIGNFIVVKCTNAYNGELKLHDGQLETTKDDVRQHGIGFEHMKKIVGSYQGALSFQAKGQRFELKWMVPCPVEG